jgi:hypothetical protein
METHAYLPCLPAGGRQGIRPDISGLISLVIFIMFPEYVFREPIFASPGWIISSRLFN